MRRHFVQTDVLEDDVRWQFFLCTDLLAKDREKVTELGVEHPAG